MASVRFPEDSNNNDAVSEIGEPPSNISKPTKRQRWATTRVAGTGGVRKRVSIIDRFHKRSELRDEKRKSSAGSSPSDKASANGAGSSDSDANRTIYFNIPIPESERDEEGQLRVTYPRNKIRTAKYTPLTFVPRNVWLQFHNIANIYFLFVIILNVSHSAVFTYPKRRSQSDLTQFSSSSFLSSVPITPVLTLFP